MPNPVSEIVGGVRMPDSGGQTCRVALPLHPDPRHRDVHQSVVAVGASGEPPVESTITSDS